MSWPEAFLGAVVVIAIAIVMIAILYFTSGGG